jgi:hypothetical protein
MKSLRNNTHFIRIQTSDSGNTYQEAAGTTAVTTEYWDTAGYTGFRFIVAAGAIAATATMDAKLQSCSTATGTYADVTGAAITQLLTADAGKIAVIEVDRPISRYYRAIITPATDDCTVDGAFVELFGMSGSTSRSVDSKVDSYIEVVNV